jgi:hypothetical protein
VQKGNLAQRSAQGCLLGEQPARLKPVIAPAAPCSLCPDRLDIAIRMVIYSVYNNPGGA